LELVVANLLNGISFASLLFLIASGLSLVFGVMGILNLAHGGLYMLGAFIGLTAASHWNSFWVGASLAALSLGILGLALERVFLRRLYKQPNDQALLTLGLVYIFSNAVVWIWGPWSKIGDSPGILSGSVNIGTFAFSIYRFGLIFIGLIMFFGLRWLQGKTRIGAIIRAGMDNREMTTALGIDYGLVSTGIFIVGAAIGGLSGFLGTPIIGAFPEMSMDILLLAMIVVVVGGLGNVQGAFFGSIIIGVIDTFGKAYFPDLATFAIYFIFILMLLVRPTGLLGRRKI
jgi:branched-chain amino acid transport system permease protein